MCFKQRLLWAGLWAGCLIAAFSCAVKEDRTDCPCNLVIGIRGGAPPYYLSLSQGTERVEDTLHTGSAAFERRVVRRPLRFQIYCADSSLYVPGKGLVIPPGRDCPPVWSAVRSLVAEGERQAEIVTLHKNHCRLSLAFKVEGQPAANFPFQLRIRGSIAGYDRDDKPVAGAFDYVPCPDGKGIFHIGLPRQTDASLALEIQDEDGVLRAFPLGDYIVQGGYDWAAPDLPDLPMEIDYARTQVTFRLECWEKTVERNVVI